MSETEQSTPTSIASDASNSEYKVGWCHPPLDTRFKPGQSGHPQGRPKGRLNNKTIVERIMNYQYTVRHGKTVLQLPLFAANLFKQGLQGAGGDDRSSGLFLKFAEKMGYLGDRNDDLALENSNGNRPDGSIPYSANQSRPSERLLAVLDPDQLSREDLAELARLSDKIDLGGDVFALSAADFQRAKDIVEKGCGKDITPRDAALRETS